MRSLLRRQILSAVVGVLLPLWDAHGKLGAINSQPKPADDRNLAFSFRVLTNQIELIGESGNPPPEALPLQQCQGIPLSCSSLFLCIFLPSKSLSLFCPQR
jgi:hypothetical protein